MKALLSSTKWLFFLVITGIVLVKFSDFEVRRLNARIDVLQEEKSQLLEFLDRHRTARRVAQINVQSQDTDPQGQLRTTLLWQEIGEDGLRGIPQSIEVLGKQAYFEGLVIKFAFHHVEEQDPERGQSLVMFRRIFGDQQSPASGFALDKQHRPPPPTQPPGTAEKTLEKRLWDLFWELMDDPELAEQYGVRIAQIEAPAVPLNPGEIWELTIESAGGLNLRKVSQQTPPA